MPKIELKNLFLFICFVVPGFISLKIWSLLVASKDKRTSEYIIDAISYSCLNFAFFAWLIIPTSKSSFPNNSPFLLWLIIVFVLFIMPIIWPFIIFKVFNSKWLLGIIVNPIPTAWDILFSKCENLFVLVHLKDGSLIGGKYGGASSFPHEHDIYLSEIWKIDENGIFQEKIEDSKGAWFDKEAFTYLEFFNYNTEVSDEKQTITPQKNN